MTDTPRTRNELKTIFANNTSKAITAQDFRDFLASLPLTTENTEWNTTGAAQANDFLPTNSPTFPNGATGIGFPTYSILTMDTSTSETELVDITELAQTLDAGIYDLGNRTR